MRLVLTGDSARAIVRAGGGHPHKCHRLSRVRFLCEATYWYQRHEAEEEPDGTLVNEVVTYLPETRSSIVGIG